MVIFVEAQCKKGDPIEAAIAEAVDGFTKRFKVAPTILRVNIQTPVSVDVPAGMVVERRRDVLPGAALAGGEAGVW